jgi:uncharacterized repeat protein (TIGR03809 family)
MQGGLHVDEISRKWLALAESRLAHFIVLYRSGRWQRYYTEQNFAVHMLDAIRAVKIWERLADRSPAPCAGKDDLRPAV